MRDLPIEAILPELKIQLKNHTAAVLIAEPGAGKTTKVPLALLDEPWLADKGIIMLEPRRLAARTAAAYMAEMLREQVGETVGYRVRADSRVGPNTRIQVVTEGILTRMLQQDPELQGVGLIIFDEFHERHLHGDLGLALSLETQDVLREDLRLLVMSATLDAAPVASLMGEPAIITCEGRQFPVDTIYAPASRDVALEISIAALIRRALSEQEGDVLVFLPGAGEIRAVEKQLSTSVLPPDIILRPLYSQLTQEEQKAAVLPDPSGLRKVILSTSIAESSVTIQGVRVVIDSGLSRTQVFTPRTGMPYLATVKVSKASADQRKGRAGRTQSGVCYRLWSAEEHAHLADRSTPEIAHTDLTQLALELAAWGVRTPQELRWLDEPPEHAFKQAVQILQQLGAVDQAGRITEQGREMAAIGTHPRIAYMLLRSISLGAGWMGCCLAALLQEGDFFVRRRRHEDADLASRMEALLKHSAHHNFIHSEQEGTNGAAVKRIIQEAKRLARRLDVEVDSTQRHLDLAGVLLSFAYPDRIGQSRGEGRYLLASGRGVELPRMQLLSRSAYIVAAEVDDQGVDGRIWLAGAIEAEQLLQHHKTLLKTHSRVVWDSEHQAVRGRTQMELGALVIKETPYSNPAPEQLAEALLQGIQKEGLEILPWTKPAKQLRQRMLFMQALYSDWPDCSDEALLNTLHDWLLPYVEGMRSRQDLQRLSLNAILEHGLMTWEQRKQLEEMAPTHFTAPSGSRIPINYDDPGMPVLAVRLQEMFGLHETPLLGGGRIRLTMQLLSPAQRPVQVTSDLASFWREAYFEVKKDLKGRYPKHYWPDNPLEGIATNRVRPKSSGMN